MRGKEGERELEWEWGQWWGERVLGMDDGQEGQE